MSQQRALLNIWIDTSPAGTDALQLLFTVVLWYMIPITHIG